MTAKEPSPATSCSSRTTCERMTSAGSMAGIERQRTGHRGPPAGRLHSVIRDRLTISAAVADALRDGRPVVALESTLISHGLPYPANIEVARASESAVSAEGATAATVAIRDGHLLVGLDEAALEALATAPDGSVMKAARPSLAAALGRAGWAATT